MKWTTQAINNLVTRKQQGASLLESIAYLGVAAIVILGAVSLLTQSFASANTNRMLEEVVSIRTNVKRLYMGQSSGFGTDSLNSVLVTAKAFPSSMTISPPSTVTNSWKGAVVVTGATQTFTISYDAVPQDVCANSVGAQGGSGWTSIAVNGAAALTPPVTPAQAGAACNATTNTIVWTAS